MPPLPAAVPIGVSFDAQNTLVEIIGGIGQQYFKHFRQFLQSKGFAIEEVMPSCTATSLHTTSYTIMRYAVNRDREVWAHSHPESKDRKEMPIGGRTEASVRQFWRQTMVDVFKSPSLYLSTPPRLKQSLLDVMEGSEWEDFLHELVHNFSTKQCYDWLPEGKRTLDALRQWSMEQDQLAYHPSGKGGSSASSSSKGKPVLILASPPFIVTNSDFRIRGVFKDLGAFQSPSAPPASSSSSSSLSSWPAGKRMPPLIGKVVTAADVGYAKPSHRGILHCIRECGLERYPERFIHVGDTEDDESACRNAGCRFVQCNANIGVQWEKLKATLAEVEKEVMESRL